MSEEIQTNDELTDKINAALEAEPDVVTPEVTETETPEIPSEEAPTPIVETPETSPEPQPVPEGYVPKDKFVASAQESILNAERVRIANEKIEQLIKTDTPTDEAMRDLYPEWDQLDDYNKRVLTRQETVAMQNAAIMAKQSEIDERQRQSDEINDVIQHSDYAPKLAGKESEFKKFAANPKNKGISAEVLAKAFLFDVVEPVPQVPKTEGLPQGNGGSREPLKTNKVSIEEAAQIRKTDNNRYMELVKSGMIDDDID